jgi:hypothetical protein
MKFESWIAIYAAIVGTGALLLNFKSWLDSGVKLSISLTPYGHLAGGAPEPGEEHFIVVTVINRGRAPTMITSFAVFERRLLRRLTGLPLTNTGLGTDQPGLKGLPSVIPADLEPAKKWRGVIQDRPDLFPNLRNGHHFVQIRATHRRRSYLKRIPRRLRQIPKGALVHD